MNTLFLNKNTYPLAEAVNIHTVLRGSKRESPLQHEKLPLTVQENERKHGGQSPF